MFCSRCGNKMEDGAGFCSACGTSVSEMVAQDDGGSAGPHAAGSSAQGASDAPEAASVSTPAPGSISAPGSAPTAVSASGLGQTPDQAGVRQGSGKRNPVPIVAAVAAVLVVAVVCVVLFVTAHRGDPQTTSMGTSTSAADGNADGSQSAGDAAAQQQVDPVVAANQEKVDAAIAEGKQVLAGTIHSTTNEDAWIMSKFGKNPNYDPNASYAGESWYEASRWKPVTVLLLDQESAIKGVKYDAGSYQTKSDSADIIDIQDSLASYDGQHVVMAFQVEDVQLPTDVSRISGSGEVLFAGDTTGVSIPGAGSSNTATVSTSSYDGDYVLPESATRVYPVSEIRGMGLSRDQLRIARNEIFARHGRGFKDAGLQSYFDSKSWYTKRYEPGSFDESQLSSTERQNIDNIKAAEG
ncbi:MAG: YARHG domain-containing protein [Actinomycetota bacterium]|nr:YARHG domain-containing protein [Actinomycetota bacterium]